MNGTHVERNERSRRRLRQVIDNLTDDRRTDGTWKASVVLAHMAFWDRFVIQRWEHARRSALATPVPVDLHLFDLINDASVPGWSLIEHRMRPALRLPPQPTSMHSSSGCPRTPSRP